MTIRVGNLSSQVNEENIREAFAKYGRIIRVSFSKDETGRKKGIALVEMTTEDGEDRAIAELNGAEWFGKIIRVKKVKEYFEQRLEEVEERLEGIEVDVETQIIRLGSQLVDFIKDQVETSYRNLRNTLHETADELILARQQVLQEELHSYLMARSLGLEPDLMKLHRFVPVQIYLPENDKLQIEQITKAVADFADKLGLEITDNFPPEIGSWFKRFFFKTKEVMSQPEVRKRLDKVEHAIELMTLQRHQADIDKAEADAAATLIKNIENIPNVVLQVGSILLIKRTTQENGAQIIARTLTPEEMICLHRNQHLLANPEELLKELSNSSQPKQLSASQETLS